MKQKALETIVLLEEDKEDEDALASDPMSMKTQNGSIKAGGPEVEQKGTILSISGGLLFAPN